MCALDSKICHGHRHFELTAGSAEHSSAFPANKLKMSGNHVYFVGALDQVLKEKLTIPLSCVTPEGQSVKHAFLLSELCPINLLSRDLLCRLGILSYLHTRWPAGHECHWPPPGFIYWCSVWSSATLIGLCVSMENWAHTSDNRFDAKHLQHCFSSRHWLYVTFRFTMHCFCV